MKTRILKNWRTTLAGLFLLALSSALLLLKVITFAEFTAFIPTVLGLLYVKDSLFGESHGEKPVK